MHREISMFDISVVICVRLEVLTPSWSPLGRILADCSIYSYKPMTKKKDDLSLESSMPMDLKVYSDSCFVL
jgi:hypothetical protein